LKERQVISIDELNELLKLMNLDEGLTINELETQLRKWIIEKRKLITDTFIKQNPIIDNSEYFVFVCGK
jgi:hypothetical protein